MFTMMDNVSGNVSGQGKVGGEQAGEAENDEGSNR